MDITVTGALGVAKAVVNVVKGCIGWRTERQHKEWLLGLRAAIRSVDRGNPAPLVFQDESLAELAKRVGIPAKELPGLIYELEREGFIVSVFGVGYSLAERYSVPGRLWAVPGR